MHTNTQLMPNIEAEQTLDMNMDEHILTHIHIKQMQSPTHIHEFNSQYM